MSCAGCLGNRIKKQREEIIELHESMNDGGIVEKKKVKVAKRRGIWISLFCEQMESEGWSYDMKFSQDGKLCIVIKKGRKAGKEECL